ncbi:RNA recognition family protein [Cryptosporidium andersoni]|uniref:RNA recognition family protein n=1 Tax=Cryptosporidium andersoni TaxID=117008 RepID=A0A1J4MYK2_9CRYT|nr:RNA recognition family protein [Cryptosporidium andersoni]
MDNLENSKVNAMESKRDFLKKKVDNPDVHDVDEGKTIFLRNIPFGTSESDLKQFFEERFGKVIYARIVLSRSTHLPKGVAFVKFRDLEAVKHVLDANDEANQYIMKTKNMNMTNKSSCAYLESLALPPNVGIQINGRRIYAQIAVKPSELADISSKKDIYMNEGIIKSKNNGHLAKFGVILRGTNEAVGLSENDLRRREDAWLERKVKLKNPNFIVNPFRLCIRNLPKKVSAVELRKIVIGCITSLDKKSLLALIENCKLEIEKIGSAGQKYMIDHSKYKYYFERFLLNSAKRFSKNEFLKILNKMISCIRIIRENSSSGSKSKGYAFINVLSHEVCKLILNKLNNNPKIFGSERRPIVEFAVEDQRAIYIQKKKRAQKDKMKSVMNKEYKLRVPKLSRGQRQRAKRRLEREQGTNQI